MIDNDSMTDLANQITELAYDLRQLELMGGYFFGDLDGYLDMPKDQFYNEHLHTTVVGGKIQRAAGLNADGSVNLSSLLTEFDYIVPLLTSYTSIDIGPYDTVSRALRDVTSHLQPLNGSPTPNGTGHDKVVVDIKDRIANWEGAFVDTFRDDFCKELSFIGCNQATIALELAEVVETYKLIIEQLQQNVWDTAQNTRAALATAVAANAEVDGGAIRKAVAGIILNVASIAVGGPSGWALALALIGLGNTTVNAVNTIDNAIEASPHSGSPVDAILGQMKEQLTLIDEDAVSAEQSLEGAIKDDMNEIDAWLQNAQQQRFLLPRDVASTGISPGDEFYPLSLP